jgi:hypothetical protein
LGFEASKGIEDDSRFVEFTGYKRGYCVAQPLGGGSAGTFLSWAHKNDPKGLWPPVPRPSKENTVIFQLKRSTDSGEYRLKYLAIFASKIKNDCERQNWSEGGKERQEQLVKTILAEAERLPRNKYEQYLFEALRSKLDPSQPKPVFMQSIYRAPEGAGVSFLDDGTVRSGIDMSKPITKDIWHCRGGNSKNCDFNERDPDGRTALMKATDIETMRALFDAGADPNIEEFPGGDTKLDSSLLAAFNLSDRTEKKNLVASLAMLEVLTKGKIATIREEMREEINSAPSTWAVHERVREYFVAAKDMIKDLPSRPEFTPSCGLTASRPVFRLR